MHPARALLPCTLVLATACSASIAPPDASRDGARPVDAADVSAPDVATDTPDGAPPLDVPLDVPLDAPPDALPDAPLDAPPDGTPTNLTCASAIALSGSSALTAQDATLATQVDRLCAGAGNYPVLYYSITVPPQQTLEVLARPNGAPQWRPSVQITDPCGAPGRACLGGARFVNGFDPAHAYFHNAASGPRDVLVLVGNEDGLPGVFDLSVTLRPAAANAACAAPVPLADGAALTGQNLLDAISPVVGCASGGNAGPALLYSATIPGNSYLSARMVPTGPVVAGSVLFWAPRLRVLGDCAGAACLAESTYPLNAVLYRNPDAAPRTVLLAASTDGGSFDGVFDLSAEIRPAPANNACASATTLTDGLHLPEENLQLATDALSGVCAPEVEGNALYYRATVPPGAQLSVVLHAIDAAQLVPRLLTACGASSCEAAYTPGSSVQHPLLWSNTGGAAQDVVVAVSSYNAFASGRFELWSNIAPPAYTEATIAGACDDLSAAPAVADVDAFRSVSDALPLPFPFALFGEVTNDFAVASTGQLELFPDETGTPTLTTVPPPMPNVVGPHRFVAPLALPLSAAPEGSSVRTQTFGAAPSRRFVVEWNNWSIPRPADASRVTFQAKLFEGSNAVEFHYCSLNGLGTSAPYQNAPLSVGLEDASGLRAVRHDVTPAAPLSTAQALRFVPAS